MDIKRTILSGTLCNVYSDVFSNQMIKKCCNGLGDVLGMHRWLLTLIYLSDLIVIVSAKQGCGLFYCPL